MAREVEFYATVEDVLPVLEPLFVRRATAFSLASNADPTVSIASSVAELRQLIDQGVMQFEVGVGDEVYPPLVDSVLNQPTGAMRYFFVDKVGGPFLEVRVPERQRVDGVMMIRPGVIATKSRYFKEPSYRNEIPDTEARQAFAEAARRIRSDFAKYVTTSNRAWYFSRSVLKEMEQGAVRLRGPLSGFEQKILELERQGKQGSGKQESE